METGHYPRTLYVSKLLRTYQINKLTHKKDEVIYFSTYLEQRTTEQRKGKSQNKENIPKPCTSLN